MNDVDIVVTRETSFDELPDYLTPEEFRQYVGIGRGAAYDLLRRAEVPSVKFGRLIRVPKSALGTNTGTPTAVLRSKPSRVR